MSTEGLCITKNELEPHQRNETNRSGDKCIVISKMELSADDPTRIALPVVLLKRSGFTHMAKASRFSFRIR